MVNDNNNLKEGSFTGQCFFVLPFHLPIILIERKIYRLLCYFLFIMTLRSNVVKMPSSESYIFLPLPSLFSYTLETIQSAPVPIRVATVTASYSWSVIAASAIAINFQHLPLLSCHRPRPQRHPHSPHSLPLLPLCGAALSSVIFHPFKPRRRPIII